MPPPHVLSALSQPATTVAGHLVLDPPAAGAGVGSDYVLTASLTDPGGQPLFGIVVRFSASPAAGGGAAASGQCVTTAQGTCTFVYRGPDTPADHAITAFADGNASAVGDPGEPLATAVAAWRQAGGNLAVIQLQAPRTIALTARRPAVAAVVKVVIQNRGSANEVIPDAAALARSVQVVVGSLGSYPAPRVLSPGRLVFPVMLGPDEKLIAAYDVAIDCANDPDRSTGAGRVRTTP